MKGETVFDIVDTGKDSRIKITDERGTRAAASRHTLKPLARIKAVRQTTGRPRKEWDWCSG
jgi:hypothetical protein